MTADLEDIERAINNAAVDIESSVEKAADKIVAALQPTQHNSRVAAWTRIQAAIDIIDGWVKEGKVVDSEELMPLRKALTGR